MRIFPFLLEIKRMLCISGFKIPPPTNKYFFLLFSGLIIYSATLAQPDLENTLPTNYRVAKGTFSFSDRHYKLGQKSLRWDWVAGDTIIIDLTPAQEAYILPRLISGQTHYFETWIYNETAAKDTFALKFYNWQGNPQFSFQFNVNYTGWRRLLRSYRANMIMMYPSFQTRVGEAQWNVDKILFLAPLTGSGTIYIDDINYIKDGGITESDYVMPDLYSKAVYKATAKDIHYSTDSLSKLVAAVTPTSSEVIDIATIRRNIEDLKHKRIPTAAELQSANNEYLTYNIVINNNQIKGTHIARPQQIGNMFSTFTYTVRNVNNNDNSSKEKLINLLRLLIDSGLDEGSGYWFAGGVEGYYDVIFFNALRDAYPLVPQDLREKIWRWLKWSTDVNLGWSPTSDGNFNTDNVFVLSTAYLCTILYSPNDATTAKDIKTLKQFVEKFLTPQKGISGGMKIDGTSFHHNGHYNIYMYAFSALIDTILTPITTQSFKINANAYNNLRKVTYGQYVSSNLTQFANSFSGRHPFLTEMIISAPLYVKLAKIGGIVLNNSYDPIIAGMYTRLTNDNTKFAGASAEPFPKGFWQMNYSPAAIYRRDNWVATMRGMTNNLWGSEIYVESNVYGRYQSYGSLEIVYPSGMQGSGMLRRGWDWNKPPGTTTIVYPFDSLKTPASLYEESLLKFAGGVKFGVPSEKTPSDIILQDFHGDYGVFGFNFQQLPSSATVTHSTSFVFRKSFFCFGDKIVCLGSNINNDRNWRNTITTLFQGILPSTSTAIEVDGSGKAAFPFSQSLNNTSAHRLLDAYKTGYYIMPGSTIQVEKKNQISPDQSGSNATSNADYANAYIDHGKAPVNGKYAYVVLPNTTSSKLNDFANNMASTSTREFEILQQDEFAHIVRQKSTDVIGLSLFTSNVNLTSNEVVKANDVPCVAMLQIRNDTLRINVVNPDINFVNNESVAIPVTIKLYGEWLKASNVAAKYATVVSTKDNETIVRFSVADGLSSEITLVNFSSAVLPINSLNLQGKIDAAASRNILTMKFENNDNAGYTLENKSATDLDWATVDAENIPGADKEQSFVFYHPNPSPGENQYRIKCTEIDGVIKYSNIVILKNQLNDNIVIAPNPARHEFSIIFKEQSVKPLQWSIIDGSGNILKAGSINSLRENVDVRALPAGMYYIRFSGGKSLPVIIMK